MKPCKDALLLIILLFLFVLNTCSAHAFNFKMNTDTGVFQFEIIQAPFGSTQGTEWSPWLSPVINNEIVYEEIVFSCNDIPSGFICEVSTDNMIPQAYEFKTEMSSNVIYKHNVRTTLRIPIDNSRGKLAFRFHLDSINPIWGPITSIGLQKKSNNIAILLENDTENTKSSLDFLLPAAWDAKKKIASFWTIDGKPYLSKEQSLLFTSTSTNEQKIHVDFIAGLKNKINFVLRTGPLRDLAIPGAYLFNKSNISFTLEGVAKLLRLSVYQTSGSNLGQLDPIPSDPDLVLSYPEKLWRVQDFEVFRWDANPQVLLLDFATTEIQDRYVKRMAFFVEKKGYRGTLLDNDALAGKHGWNANNYRPEDIAAYYNLALKSNFQLNQEENKLCEYLLQWKILSRGQDGFYKAENGGIISIARGMNFSTRKLLLNHEALHGLFYTSERLRSDSEMYWRNLDSTAKSFLTRYFDYYQYDINDSYLMINEFQAYLLQQSIQSLPEFLMRIARRLGKENDHETMIYAEKAALSEAILVNIAKKLRKIIDEEFGLTSGDVGMIRFQN